MRHESFDQVRLVDDAGGLAAGDADEDNLVEPVERRSGGLDPGRGPEDVLAGCPSETSSNPMSAARSMLGGTATWLPAVAASFAR